MRRRPFQFRGFTLLELIIAMMMVATLALALFTSLKTALVAKKSADALVAPIRAVGTAADLICKDVDSVVLPNANITNAIQGTGSGTSSTVSNGPNVNISSNSSADLPLYLYGEFTGTDNGSGDSSSDTLDFYTIGSDGTPDVLNSEGVRHVQIGISTDGGTPNLVRSVTRNLLSPNEPTSEIETLCTNVKSFSLRYFDGSDWYDDWDSSSTDTPNQLPLVIEMILVLNVPDLQMPSEEAGTYRITRLIPVPLGTVNTGTTSTGTTP